MKLIAMANVNVRNRNGCRIPVKNTKVCATRNAVNPPKRSFAVDSEGFVNV